MRNKVIKFGSATPTQAPVNETTSQDEVYVDINMTSKPNIQSKCPSITDSKYQLFKTLAQEHPGEEKAKDLVLTEQEREEVKMLYGIDYVQFNQDYDLFMRLAPWAIDSSINVRAIQNSLHNIFTWIPGERILLPEFGSKVRKLLYEGLTEYNTEQIVAEIRKSVSEWEPRVQIQNIINIGNIDDKEDNTVHLEIIYTIPSLSEKQYNYSLYSYR